MNLFEFLLWSYLVAHGSLARTLNLTGPSALPSTASHVLHPALASFSIETAFFISYVGNLSSINNLTRNLLENLKDRAGTPAEVRLGGITADSTYWDPALDSEIFNFVDDDGVLHNTTIGPKFFDTFKFLPEDTKIIMNLNLRDLDYEGALAVARGTVEGLDPGQLIALEIGNEPDHYLSFTPENYTAIWTPWSRNITESLNLPLPFFQVGATAEDPLWPYGTPEAEAQLDCVSALAAGANSEGTVKWCSEHTYQYSVCDPRRAAVATLPNLVNHTRLAMYLDLWQPLIRSVREQLGDDAFVIGEYNSVSCSGHDGVSNTFGDAMWLLDTTLYAASINISRLYIHQGGPLALQSSTQLNRGGLSLYNLWYPVENLNGPVKVFPSYYAYLFVAETLGHSTSLRMANIYPGRQSNGSTITQAVGGEDSAGELVVYAFWEDNAREYPSKFALLNMEIFNSTQRNETRPSTSVHLSAFLPPDLRTGKVGTVRRLQASGAEVKWANETWWAGQSYESGIGEGDLLESEVLDGVVTLSASEAALVVL